MYTGYLEWSKLNPSMREGGIVQFKLSSAERDEKEGKEGLARGGDTCTRSEVCTRDGVTTLYVSSYGTLTGSDHTLP